MSCEKLDIIYGFPAPTEKQIKVFQSNHKIEADGIIGRVTRKKIWRERGAKNGYTHLIDTPLKSWGDTETQEWMLGYLDKNPSLCERIGLEPEPVTIIWTFLTSRFKTGRKYLSTQDGITLGPRRLAADTLREFLIENRNLVRKYLPLDLYRKLVREGSLPDFNNGFPLNREDYRIAFLELVEDPNFWVACLEDGSELIRRVLDTYPHWTDARLITLAVRAANSQAYRFTGTPGNPKLPQRNERKAYRKLKKEYENARESKTYNRRVQRIEQRIPKGAKWRRL